MIVWLLLNTFFRVGIMMIVVIKLTLYRDSFNCPERVGLGLAGGAGLMTIPNIWHPGSPFEAWAAAIFSAGIFIYFIGRMLRHMPGYRLGHEHLPLGGKP